MATTTEQQRAVAYLARAIRASTPGAPNFDEPGVMAALARVQHLNLAMVTMAAIRCAADPSIKTPAMIGDPSSTVYVERVGPERARRHVARVDACRRCGRELTGDCCDNPSDRVTPGDYTSHAAAARKALHP